MISPITGSMLYDYVQCPHRVFLDLFGDPRRRDPVSAFVQLLWERGTAFERETIQELEIPFVNLKNYSAAERERLTFEAMKKGNGLIYGGRIRIANLLGEPVLLKREGSGYVAGDMTIAVPCGCSWRQFGFYRYRGRLLYETVIHELPPILWEVLWAGQRFFNWVSFIMPLVFFGWLWLKGL